MSARCIVNPCCPKCKAIAVEAIRRNYPGIVITEVE
jgi:hypothetical protein